MKGRLAAPLAVAVALLATLVLWAPWSPGGQKVDAVFSSVNGLVRGAEVRAGGVRVGEVDAIRLDDHGLPRVTLSLDGDYNLREGARADVRLASLSGELNRYVALHNGGGPVLSDGAVLGLAQTDQPVEVDDVLSTLDPATRREARGILRGLAGATRDQGQAIAASLRRSSAALDRTAAMLGQVTADGQALKDIVRSSRRITAALAADPGTTSAAVSGLADLLHDTAAEQEQLAAGVGALPVGLGATNAALVRLRALVPDLRALVMQAAPGVDQLRGAAPELRDLLLRGAPVLDDAAGLAGEAPGELRAISALLPTAQRVLPRLTETTAAANPLLDNVRVRLPDFFSFFANWADFTANYDANGHAARVGLVFGPAPLNTTGADGVARGQMKAPFVRTPGALENVPWSDYRSSFVGGGG